MQCLCHKFKQKRGSNQNDFFAYYKWNIKVGFLALNTSFMREFCRRERLQVGVACRCETLLEGVACRF